LIDDAHEQLAFAGFRRRAFRQLKIIEAGCAFRPALEQDLAVDPCNHRYSPLVATIKSKLMSAGAGEGISRPQYLV
jgi:hypothetical protein